ncbi:MAG TPA: trypsin-like serine protease [Zeimonas sp.]
MLKECIPGCGWGSRILSGFLLSLGFVACANAIPNGTRTSDYAYVGAVYFGGYWGSGVLIAPGVVLTAGHVVEDANDSRTTPFFLRGADPLSDPGVVGYFSYTVLHPLYETGDFDQYDIGLIFLSGSVGLEEYVALSSEPGLALRSETVDIVGYGSDLVRSKTTNRINDALTTEALLYVVGESGVVEPGDSGGGLFVERDGQKRLAGITSWTTGEISAFASVSYYRDFIDEHVRGVAWLPASAVTQPGTASLVGLGLLGLCMNRKRTTA